MRLFRLRAVAALPAIPLLLAAAPAQQEAAAPDPLLTIEQVSVEPANPAADTLCRLRVKLRNRGEESASQLGFAVSINGQDLGVYGNQLFMYAVPAGASEEIPLYNFWSTESSRGMPADGKLRVEVTLREAIWTRVAMEQDEESEIEVWTPIGPVEGLPARAAVTLEMKGGG